MEISKEVFFFSDKGHNFFLLCFLFYLLVLNVDMGLEVQQPSRHHESESLALRREGREEEPEK